MSLRPVILRLSVFVTVMVLILVGMFIVLGEYRFESHTTFEAEFADASGLRRGEFIRVAGVEVGTVAQVRVTGDGHALVTMDVRPDYQVTGQTHATVRYANLVGDRYLELHRGPGDPAPLPAGSRLGTDRTSPALNLDELLGSFKPLFRALDPPQVNNLTQELIAVFQGQGGTVESVLAHTATLTTAIADRDEVVGRVVENLNTVLGTLSDQREDLSEALGHAQELATGLAADSARWGPALSSIDESAVAITGLLTEARPPLAETVHQLGRAATQLDEGRDTLESVITRLPTAYDSLSRLGAYGNFFNYYLCGMRIKVSGPDGQDLAVRFFGQTTGRCAPR